MQMHDPSQFTQPVVDQRPELRRVGLIPAKPLSQRLHKLGVRLALMRPAFPLAPGSRPPSHAKPGTSVYLTVEPVSKHPEHPELRAWYCDHISCARDRWASAEELIAAHDEAKLRQHRELHVYYCVLEIPEEGARPASVHILTTEEQ